MQDIADRSSQLPARLPRSSDALAAQFPLNIPAIPTASKSAQTLSASSLGEENPIPSSRGSSSGDPELINFGVLLQATGNVSLLGSVIDPGRLSELVPSADEQPSFGETVPNRTLPLESLTDVDESSVSLVSPASLPLGELRSPIPSVSVATIVAEITHTDVAQPDADLLGDSAFTLESAALQQDDVALRPAESALPPTRVHAEAPADELLLTSNASKYDPSLQFLTLRDPITSIAVPVRLAGTPGDILQTEQKQQLLGSPVDHLAGVGDDRVPIAVDALTASHVDHADAPLTAPILTETSPESTILREPALPLIPSSNISSGFTQVRPATTGSQRTAATVDGNLPSQLLSAASHSSSQAGLANVFTTVSEHSPAPQETEAVPEIRQTSSEFGTLENPIQSKPKSVAEQLTTADPEPLPPDHTAGTVRDSELITAELPASTNEADLATPRFDAISFGELRTLNDQQTTTEITRSVTHPQIARQIADTIVSQAVQTEAGDTVTLDAVLDPPELGRLHVRLMRTTTSLTATVSAENSDVQQVIADHTTTIEHSIRTHLKADESLHFQTSDSPLHDGTGTSNGREQSRQSGIGHHQTHPHQESNETSDSHRTSQAEVDVLA